ncbi:hypothetical protein [Streptomyces sp. NPDC056660]|uniref:hypothetical protein n=1 Tax=Streptomyces sp. NPDC056660 TaxID=3345897 RepID=UPI0036C53C03
MTIRLAGEQVKVFLFAVRLSYSGKAVHRNFASCGQEAFFEGHVHALSVLGGIPGGKVRYDNLRAAVARVPGLPRARVENERRGGRPGRLVQAKPPGPRPGSRLSRRTQRDGGAVGCRG